jgi:hypothetical protein
MRSETYNSQTISYAKKRQVRPKAYLKNSEVRTQK